jgi:hypothetical protein
VLLGGVYVTEGAWTLLAVPDMALAGWVSVVIGVPLTMILPTDGMSRRRASVAVVPLAGLGIAATAAIDLAFRTAWGSTAPRMLNGAWGASRSSRTAATRPGRR